MSALVEKFSSYLREEIGRPDNTVNAYKRDVVLFFKWSKKSPAEITVEDARNWKKELTKVGLKTNTINRKLSSLKSFYKYVCRYEKVKNNPFRDIEGMGVGSRLPKAIAIEEVERLLEAPQGDDPVSLRDKALLHMMFVAGLRISEVVALNVSDLKNEQVRVIGKGNKERIVPIVFEDSLKVIDRYINLARPKLAPANEKAMFVSYMRQRISPSGVRKILDKYQEQAGITRITPHVLRHSIATYLLDRGVGIRYIKDFLGHSNIGTTQIYTKVTTESLVRTLKGALA